MFGERSDNAAEEHMRQSILATRLFNARANRVLREFLAQHPEVQLVLSSAWRLDVWHDNIRDSMDRLFMFHPWIGERVTDVTPRQNASKQKTILKWVKIHKPDQWVVLDDENLTKKLPPGHFVHVNRDNLLTAENMNQARHLLGLAPSAVETCFPTKKWYFVPEVAKHRDSVFDLLETIAAYTKNPRPFLEGSVQILLDATPWRLWYYYSKQQRLELFIVTNPNLIDTMFESGKHKWDRIALLLELDFVTQKANIQAMRPERGPFPMASLFRFCDLVCMSTGMACCEIHTAISGDEDDTKIEDDTKMDPDVHNFGMLLCGKPILEAQFGYTLPDTVAEFPHTSVCKALCASSDLSVVTSIIRSAACRESMAKGYREQMRYEEDQNERAELLLLQFDDNVARFGSLLQECMQTPRPLRVHTLARFLLWVWENKKNDFASMTALFFPPPSQRVCVPSCPELWSWTSDYDVLWYALQRKYKTFHPQPDVQS